MKIVVVVVLSVGLAIAAQASTTPGTILTTSAAAAYTDSAGQSMPQKSSNQANVLVVPADPGRTVMLSVRSLHYGPSTVGMTVRIVGKVFSDANGTWIDDGSRQIYRDSTGKLRSSPLLCKVSTVFLAQPPAAGRWIVTGISQVEQDGTRIIIPSADTDIRSL